jgi:hypothetical protein
MTAARKRVEAGGFKMGGATLHCLCWYCCLIYIHVSAIFVFTYHVHTFHFSNKSLTYKNRRKYTKEVIEKVFAIMKTSGAGHPRPLLGIEI